MLHHFAPPSTKAMIIDKDTTNHILHSDVEEIDDWVVDSDTYEIERTNQQCYHNRLWIQEAYPCLVSTRTEQVC